jgi:hypothetical protein
VLSSRLSHRTRSRSRCAAALPGKQHSGAVRAAVPVSGESSSAARRCSECRVAWEAAVTPPGFQSRPTQAVARVPSRPPPRTRAPVLGVVKSWCGCSSFSAVAQRAGVPARSPARRHRPAAVWLDGWAGRAPTMWSRTARASARRTRHARGRAPAAHPGRVASRRTPDRLRPERRLAAGRRGLVESRVARSGRAAPVCSGALRDSLDEMRLSPSMARCLRPRRAEISCGCVRRLRAGRAGSRGAGWPRGDDAALLRSPG